MVESKYTTLIGDPKQATSIYMMAQLSNCNIPIGATISINEVNTIITKCNII